MRRLIWVAAAFAVAAGAPSAHAAATPDYFTLPAGLTGISGGLDVASDGSVYFGSAGANAWATRGRHFGWMALSAVVAMAVAGY